MCVIRLAGALVLAAAACAQNPDGSAVLARIRTVVRRHLSSLPNYTCVETLERRMRGPRAKTFAPIDRVRFEVALVDGAELYAWPGSPKFEGRDLSELVGTGSETGDFAMHTRAIFDSPEPVYTYRGRELLDGRPAEKFHFVVPRARSGFTVRYDKNQGAVGYEGDFWNDAETLEVRRIEFQANDIPDHLPVAALHKRLDFAPVRLGAAAHTLPARSETLMRYTAGGEFQMLTTFSGCRQYTGESTLIFDEPAPEAAPSAAPGDITLPPGVDLHLKLMDTLDARTVARGDVSVWLVERDVKAGRRVVLKRGAQVELRVENFTCTDNPLPFCLVQFSPERLRGAGSTGVLNAGLVEPNLQTTLDLYFRGSVRRMSETLSVIRRGRPLSGSVLVRNFDGQLHAGFQTIWRTVRPK